MKPTNPDTQAALALDTLRGALKNARTRRHELRFRVARDVWAVAKRFGSPEIDHVDVREVPAVQDAVIEGYIDDPNRAVLAAVCKALSAETFFEIGTNRGRTAWTVARNNPQCHVYTLDLPNQSALADVALDLNASDRDFFVETWDRGEAYLGTPEEDRITTLGGDSATFDYSAYIGKMDVVFIDGAHSYAYVKSDTENALKMLKPGGALLWDDYPAIPGVYRYLNEIAGTLEHPLYHIDGTRLVLCTGSDLLERVAADAQGRQFAA